MNKGNKNEFTVKKNYDDIFIRNLLLATSYFFYDLLEITEVKNNVEIKKRVKCFHSMTGDQQYLSDFYLNNHQYDNEFDTKIEGNYKQIPSGVFTIIASGIQNSQLSGGYERMEFVMDVENQFGSSQETFSAMTQFMPEKYTIDLEIRSSSEAERMKIYDCLMEKIYKTKKFYFKYKGFNKIPCHVSFPDNPNMEQTFKFRTNSVDGLPLIKCNIELATQRPVIDETTIMKRSERIQKMEVQRTVREKKHYNDGSLNT